MTSSTQQKVVEEVNRLTGGHATLESAQVLRILGTATY